MKGSNSSRARVLWIIWDGASFCVAEEMLRQGLLPNLANLSREGILSPLEPPFPNCQTPVAMAELLTGVEASSHGITGFFLPAYGPQRLRERVVAFERALGAEPIWEVVARSGARTALAHIPWSIRSEIAPCWAVNYAVEAYSRCVAPPNSFLFPAPNAWEGSESIDVANQHLILTACEKGIRAKVPGDRAIDISYSHDASCWVPLRFGLRRGTWCTAWQNSDGLVGFAHTGVWETRTHPRDVPDNGGDPFIGDGLGDMYRRGGFGPKGQVEPSGAAEQRFENAMRLQADQFCRASVTAVTYSENTDLVICYHPSIDEVQHEFFGSCVDENAKGSFSVKGIVARTYQKLDAHLGRILSQIDSNWTVILSSDHGCAPVYRNFYVNEHLATCGYFHFSRDDLVDLERSQAVFHVARSGAVFLNPRALSSATGADALLEQVAKDVLAAADPVTLRAPVCAVYSRISPPPSGWDETFGDLFLVPAKGYDLRAERRRDRKVYSEANKEGAHTVNDGSELLKGLLAVRGEPWFLRDARNVRRNRDVFHLAHRVLVDNDGEMRC